MQATTMIPMILLVSLMSSACDRAPDPYLLSGDNPANAGVTTQAEDDATTGDRTPDIEAGAPLPSLVSCDPVLEWVTQADIYEIVYGSPLLTVAPGGGLAARAGGGPLAFYRMSDGAALGTEWSNWDEVLDRNWSRRMVVVQQGDEAAWVEIQDSKTGEIVHTREALPSPAPELTWLRLMRAFLTPDGAHLATLTCWSMIPSDTSVARLQLYDLETGSEGPIVDLDVDCGDNLWPRAAPAALSDDGRRLAVTFPAHPEVFVVDLEAGTAEAFDPVGDLPDGEPITENWGYGDTAILSIAIHPDGEAFALTDRAGRVTRWTLPGLASMGDPWEAALVGINQYTYGPSMESPVVWSKDGLLLAHLDSSGEAVIRLADSGEVLLTLPRPDISPPDWTGPDLFNPATGFHFTADGSGILVSFETALGYWRCPDGPPVEATGVIGLVTIDGPTAVNSYESYSWTATAETGGQPAVYRMLLDGEPVATSLKGVLATTLYSPGVHTLQAQVDDGFNQVTSQPLQVNSE